MAVSAALREFVAKVENGEIDPSAWIDLRPGEPGYDYVYAAEVAEVDPMARTAKDRDELPSCGIYFGCRPWERASEGGTVDLPMIAPDGAPCVVEVCRICGSGLAGINIGEKVVCGGCLKVGDPALEARIAASR